MFRPGKPKGDIPVCPTALESDFVRLGPAPLPQAFFFRLRECVIVEKFMCLLVPARCCRPFFCLRIRAFVLHFVFIVQASLPQAIHCFG